MCCKELPWDDDDGRIHAALVGIAHFRPDQTRARRLLAFDGGLQNSGNFRRRHFDKRRIIGRLNAVKQSIYPALFQCGNIVELRKIKEIEFTGNVALNVVTPFLGNTVPFVHCDDECTACFQCEACNGRVLVGDVLLRVQYQNGNVLRLPPPAWL